MLIFDQKYGSRYVDRAVTTAPNRAASSEKNHTPLVPSWLRAYVRTFVSANLENHGVDGTLGNPTRNKNGTSPTHAEPSNVSTVSPGGSNRCTSAVSKRQWMNVSSSHQ